MRVLYVAPRYHTNQVPVIRGWLGKGHQVMFLSQFAGGGEDYSDLKPVVLGYSKAAERLLHLWTRGRYGRRYTVEKEYALKVKAGVPPTGKLKAYIRAFHPDVVIVRERSIYNIPVCRICRKHNIPCILYNQSPLWDVPGRDNGMAHRLLLRFLPKYRMTPVLGSREKGCVKTENAAYIPFVIEPHMAPQEKEHFCDGKIHILCVARYEERKNLFMLVDVIYELMGKYGIYLTIAGEARDDGQKAYYHKLEHLVREYGMGDCVSLLYNLDRDSVYREYEKADLFVLPSTRERASVSQLEAMSCSVPVICSDTNGTACYIKPGSNGYTFRDMDRQDLKEKIGSILSDRERLMQMGENSYREVLEKYQFANYYSGIAQMIERIEKESCRGWQSQ